MMRPDKHKKKNATYKKKHNMHTDKKSGSTSQVQKDSGRTEQFFDDGLQTESRPTSQTEELVTSKVYHRRKIESNWEKYAYESSTDTEADIPVHAADYEQLLKATCNVKTQYQFRSFEPHDDDGGGEASEERQVQVLTVDSQRLTESVRCLPLHQRLHIDNSLLDKSDIDAFHAAVTQQTTAASVTCPVAGNQNCDELKSQPAVNDCSQHHQVTSSSAAAAAAAWNCTESETLRQLEDELDSLLSV